MELVADMDRDENNVVPDGVGELDKQLYEAGAGKWLGCDEQEYAQAFREATDSSEKLGSQIKGISLEPVYVSETRLQQQFYQVARLIKAHASQKA